MDEVARKAQAMAEQAARVEAERGRQATTPVNPNVEERIVPQGVPPEPGSTVTLVFDGDLRFLGIENEQGQRIRIGRWNETMDRLTITIATLADPSKPAAGQAHSKRNKAEQAAALAVAPKTGSLRWLVLEQLFGAGDQGLIAEEVAANIGCPRTTAGPRISELRHGGWVENSGRIRINENGHESTVWVLTSAGLHRCRKEMGWQ